MNNRNGELTKKAEMLEMDFLQEMGVDTLDKYVEVEKHIDKLHDILIGENDDLYNLDDFGLNRIEFEEMCGDLKDKDNAIDSASCTLSNMKKVVNSMRKSDLKTTLLSYIERMEMDLC